MRKNIEMISATALRSPAQITATATTKLSTVARRGSSEGPEPFPKNTSGRSRRSWPIACKMRGAPKKLPNAELNVAANTPRTTSGPKMLISCRAPNGSAISCSRSVAPAVSTICAV